MLGIDLVTLAALLGHSRVQMMLRCAHPLATVGFLLFPEMLDVAERLEARVGIEPTHKGFADLSLTAWVPRHLLDIVPPGGANLGLAAATFSSSRLAARGKA